MSTEYTEEEQAKIDKIKESVASFSADDIIQSMLRHSMADIVTLNNSGLDRTEANNVNE